MSISLPSDYTPNKIIRWNGVENSYIVFRDNLILSAFKGSTLIYELVEDDTPAPVEEQDLTVFEAGRGHSYYYTYDIENEDVIKTAVNWNDNPTLKFTPGIAGTYQIMICGGAGGGASSERTGDGGKTAQYGFGGRGAWGKAKVKLEVKEYNIYVGKTGTAGFSYDGSTAAGTDGTATYITNVLTCYGGKHGEARDRKTDTDWSTGGDGGTYSINQTVVKNISLCNGAKGGSDEYKDSGKEYSPYSNPQTTIFNGIKTSYMEVVPPWNIKTKKDFKFKDGNDIFYIGEHNYNYTYTSPKGKTLNGHFSSILNFNCGSCDPNSTPSSGGYIRITYLGDESLF